MIFKKNENVFFYLMLTRFFQTVNTNAITVIVAITRYTSPKGIPGGVGEDVP